MKNEMRFSRRQFAALVGTVSYGVLAPEGAEATTVQALTLSDLVSGAERATVGVPVHYTSDWAYIGGAKRIVTWTRVVQEDDLMADEPEGDEILVMTLGGKVGSLRQKVPGEATLTLGQKALVFTGPETRQGVRRVIGMAQGLYPVRVADSRETLQKSRGLPHLYRGAPRGAQPKPEAVDTLHGKTLKQARQLIVEAR
jgi:hypothetical protein